MTKPEVIGWRACYTGGQAHYWKTRPDMKTAISLCWMIFETDKLTDKTSGHHCTTCELMIARENGTECMRYMRGVRENEK